MYGTFLSHGHQGGRIRTITAEHPWRWLSSGWLDMCSKPGPSYFCGAIFAGFGFALLMGLDSVDLGFLILPLAFGFILIGPAAAVGLYEISRRLDQGLPIRMADVRGALGRNPGQIALIGLFLLVAFVAWMRLSMMEFMLFFGSAPPSLDHLVDALVQSPLAMPFLLVGIITGAVLAVGTFAMTAIAIPMLVDRPDCDAMTAMLTSLAAVRLNWRPMALWAFLIGGFTLFGVILFFLGLVVTLPLIGHASWHAYRDLVEGAD